MKYIDLDKDLYSLESKIIFFLILYDYISRLFIIYIYEYILIISLLHNEIVRFSKSEFSSILI